MKRKLIDFLLPGTLTVALLVISGCNSRPPAPTVKVANHDAHGSSRVQEEAAKYKGGRPRGHTAAPSAPAKAHKSK